MDKNNKIQKNISKITKEDKEIDTDGNFTAWEQDKNFLIVDDANNQYFRDLKKKVKSDTGLGFTYNKLLTLLLEAVDMKKFDSRIKIIKDVMKGGIKK